MKHSILTLVAAACVVHVIHVKNRGIAELLASYERLYADPLETCDMHTRQCSVNITVRQLAAMGATLANGGLNPVTKERCLEAAHVPERLPVMMTTGINF